MKSIIEAVEKRVNNNFYIQKEWENGENKLAEKCIRTGKKC
jgi:hypothetical protein